MSAGLWRAFAATILVTTIATAGPAAAAGPIVDRAAESLRRDPVYIDPQAEQALSATDADRLRSAIRDGTHPVFVAILPAAAANEAGGDASGVPAALADAVGFRGTYAVIAGNRFRAGSNLLSGAVVSSIATDAFQDRRSDGPAAVLLAFVERVQDAPAGSGAGAQDPFDEGQGNQREAERDGGGSGSVMPVLLLLGAGGGAAFLWHRRRQARARQEELTDLQQSLRADLQLLADDVMSLEPEVALHDEARADYEAGVNRYRWAQAAVDAVDSPDDVPRIERALLEGQYAMARVRAIVQGREPPPPPRQLRTEGPNREPAVDIDERGEPMYAGYGGGWYGGGFFGGNDLFAGILLGQMLGGFGGWGWGSGMAYERGYEAGRDDAGHDSGGDFGGGDFGGGDFGGGDFGGGDVGGGDF